MSRRHFQSCTPSEMDRENFVAHFGAIYEHAPWVAERTFERGLTREHDRIEALHALMSEVMRESDRETQLGLIRAHPDLAGKAAIAGELTEASRSEQAGAGIQACSAEEFARFTALNQAYRAKFGFPFIMAVTGCHREQILSAFEQRLQHGEDQEFQRALQEINRIARFRLLAM